MSNIAKVTTGLAATVVVLTLGGCGSPAKPIVADPPSAAAPPTASPAKPVKDLPDGRADVCSNIDPDSFDLPDDLAAAFTQAEVASATCEVLRFQAEAGWTDLALPGDVVEESGGQAITEVLRPWLSERALGDATALASKAASGDRDAEDDLFGLTAVNLTNPDWMLRAEVEKDGLVVGDREWSDATVTLDQDSDAAGRERIDVTLTFTDQMLLASKADGSPGDVPAIREITYAMTQTSLGDHPWLVDGWEASWKFGTPTVDDGADK